MPRSRSILLIDDQRDLLEITRIFLERYGEMTVRTAASAVDALELLGKNPFDAIVVDYDLPDINGVEFLKILRKKGDTTPVILFTGIGKEHAAIEALNNGADFFVKKGDEPQTQFRTLVDVITRAIEHRTSGRGMGTSQKILEDAINFFSEPAYAVDYQGTVVAWNRAMAAFTGTDPGAVRGKKIADISPAILGPRAVMLTDLVFEKDEEISRHRYTGISREDGYIFARIKRSLPGSGEKILQMKAAVLMDAKGMFIGAIGSVGEIADPNAGPVPEETPSDDWEAPMFPDTAPGGVIARLKSTVRADYREATRLCYSSGKYAEAIPFFNKVLEADPSYAVAWHDLGVCYREREEEQEALRCFVRSVELEPEDDEFLYSLGDMLKSIALHHDHKNYLDAAAQVFTKVVEINPNQADAWNSLGICMREQGRDELSRQYFDRARDLLMWNKATRKTRNFNLKA